MKVRDASDIYDNRPLIVKASELKNTQTGFEPPFTLGKPKEGTKEGGKVLAMDAAISNVLSGFKDELSYIAMPKFVGYPMLANISQEALIRAGVETIADEMTRKFVEYTYDDDDGEDSEKKDDLITKMEAQAAKYKLVETANKAFVMDGLFGGCLIYIDMGNLTDEEKEEPLIFDKKTFKKGSFRGFKVIEPINCYPGWYNTTDPTSSEYFKPKYWYILGKKYHASRFIYIALNEAPLLLKPAYNFFGIPRAQLALDYVAQFVANRESAQELLNKFSLTCWKTNMAQVLQGASTSDLVKRAKLFNRMKHNSGVMLLDKESEDMVQLNTPLGGVRDIVEMSLNLLTAVWRIPKIKYLGEGEGGLNASSKEQMRSFYDFILSQKEKGVTQMMETVLKIFQLNLGLDINEALGFKFPSLVEMDEADRASLNKMQADRDNIYLSAGVISQEEVRQRLSMDKNSGYSMIDVDEVPEMPEEPLKDDEKVETDEQDRIAADMAMDDKWITIGARKPSGDDEGRKGRHILLKNGEEPVEAIERTVGKDIDGDGKVGKKEDETEKTSEKEPSKETKEEYKEEKDDVKSEKNDSESSEEDISKLTDEELTSKRDEAASKRKELTQKEDEYVGQNEKFKELSSQIREMEIRGWSLHGEEAKEKGKERDEKIEEKISLERSLRKEFREKNGSWLDFYSKEGEYGKELRLRNEAKVQKVNEKIESIGKSITKENTEEKLGELLKINDELNKFTAYDRIKARKEVDEKINKPLIKAMSETISDDVKKYKSKTDSFVNTLSSVDEEYNKAEQKNKEMKKLAEDAFEKYSKERDSEKSEELRKEWRSYCEQQYKALDDIILKRKERMSLLAKKIRNDFGDTGVKIETNAGKKGSFSYGVYQKISDLLDGVVGEKISTKNPPKISAGVNRAYYNKAKGIKLNKESRPGTMVHEFVHFLEENNPRMLAKSKAFLEYRTKGEGAAKLNKIMGDSFYGNSEIAKKDNFFSPYCGKLYGSNQEYYSADATELMSMGVQRLFEEPAKFAEEDREYFDFVIGNLRGEL